MARQDRKKRVTKKWHKTSILVLNISRRLNDIKQIIRQQFKYLKFKILHCKATVPFMSCCSLFKEKKECSLPKSVCDLHFTVRCLRQRCNHEGLYSGRSVSFSFFVWNLWAQSHILCNFCLVGGYCFFQL